MNSTKKKQWLPLLKAATKTDKIRCHQPHESNGLFYSLDEKGNLKSVGLAQNPADPSEFRYQFVSTLTLDTDQQASFQQSRTCSIFYQNKKEIHHHSAYSESAHIERAQVSLDAWIHNIIEHLVQRAQGRS